MNLLFEIEFVRLVFCHWNWVCRNWFPLNWNRALQTRFQYSLNKNKLFSSNNRNSSSPTNPIKPRETHNEINKPTWSMLWLRLGCWLRTQSRTRRALAVLCLERRGGSSTPVWCFLVLFARARSVGLGGLRFQWRRRGSDLWVWVGWGLVTKKLGLHSVEQFWWGTISSL